MGRLPTPPLLVWLLAFEQRLRPRRSSAAAPEMCVCWEIERVPGKGRATSKKARMSKNAMPMQRGLHDNWAWPIAMMMWGEGCTSGQQPKPEANAYFQRRQTGK
jgi:hypothetical protein